MGEVMELILDKGRGGSLDALRTLERHWRLSDRPIKLELPPLVDAKSIAEAQARVLEASTDGKRLTPRLGLAFATMIEYRRRALETVEIEADVREIEEHDARERAKGRR
jgi:hypothetical protein